MRKLPLARASTSKDYGGATTKARSYKEAFRPMKLMCAVSIVALSIWPAVAQESGQANPKTFTLSPIQAAQLLIVNHRLDDAKRLLEQILAAWPDESEGQF